jgi:cytochrome c biogenesis protein CcdA
MRYLRCLLIVLLAIITSGGIPAGENASPAESTPASGTPAKHQLVAHYYFTPGCKMCEPTNKAIRAVEKKYGERLKVEWHNLHKNEAAFEEYLKRLMAMNIEDTPKLAVFIGDKYIGTGEKIIQQFAPMTDKLFAEIGSNPTTAVTVNPQPSPTRTEELSEKELTRRSSLFVIITGGLVDGVNPCAFATVILFVSMLSGLGKGRKEILYVGLSFILAVFITYIGIGLLLFEVRGYLVKFKTVSRVIDWGAFGLVVVAAILSIVDAVQALRTDGKGEMLLVLPDTLKSRIRKRLRLTAHSGALVATSFLTGVIIAFLESACTGQIYLPIVNILVKNQETRMEGLLKLLVYNVMFILPLLAVFLAVFWGMTSEQVANMARKRVWITKLCLAAVFLIMAGLIGYPLVMELMPA